MLDLINRALALLRDGKPARLTERKPEEERAFHMLGLLTVAAGALRLQRRGERGGERQCVLAKVEDTGRSRKARPRSSSRPRSKSEIAVLSRDERTEYLAAVGLKEAGLDRLIRAGYALLDLVTYFTAGPKEARAWTITRGTKAPQAAGVIHTDFEHGFIRAETIAYDDYVACGGEAGARDAGKMRLEGKEYVVHDGDIMHFRFAT